MAIETPCINVCVVDPASRLCRGCGRTLDEIGRWSVMTAAERRQVMTELSARLLRLDPADSAAGSARG
jgi:uncharacterized protein